MVTSLLATSLLITAVVSPAQFWWVSFCLAVSNSAYFSLSPIDSVCNGQSNCRWTLYVSADLFWSQKTFVLLPFSCAWLCPNADSLQMSRDRVRVEQKWRTESRIVKNKFGCWELSIRVANCTLKCGISLQLEKKVSFINLIRVAPYSLRHMVSSPMMTQRRSLSILLGGLTSLWMSSMMSMSLPTAF